MKKSLLITFLIGVFLLVVPVVAQDAPLPEPPANGWFVLDQLGWFSQAQIDKMNTIAKGLKEAQLGEIGVATVNNCGGDHVKFRNDLFRKWGIGNKERNDGLLILLCWQDGGKSRTLEQATGYGTEGIIPDLLTKKVFDTYFVPAFKGKDSNQVISSGAGGQAIVDMVSYYDTLFRGGKAAIQAATPVAPKGLDIPDWLVIAAVIIIIAIIVIFVLAIFFGVDFGSGTGGGYSSGGYSGGDSGGGSGDSGGGGFSGGSAGGGGSSGSF